MPRQNRSQCPITTTLDLVGDRWTLVILRDLMTGKCRFSEFLAAPEGITTNILSDRLGAMALSGFIEKRRYQDHPKRYSYHLTEKGAGLRPVLQEMCRWANRHYPQTWTPPAEFMA